MAKKLTQEDFELKANAKHNNKYTYGIYTSAKQKMEIVCPVHGRFEQKPNDHLSGYGCAKCAKVSTPTSDEFTAMAVKVHGDLYTYAHFINMSTPATITCRIHGGFTMMPSSHLKGATCPQCGDRRILTQEDFESRAHLKHGNKFTYGAYVASKLKMEIICPVHGVFSQTPSSHLRGVGCPKCSGKAIPTQEDFESRAHLKHGNKFTYGAYVTSKLKMEITCPAHGVFFQKPNDHLNGSGCPSCGGNTLITQSQFESRSSTIFMGKFTEFGTFTGTTNLVDIKCPVHGWYKQLAKTHLQGKDCYLCSQLKKAMSNTLSQDEFITKSNVIYSGKFTEFGEYVNNKTPIDIKCPVHGWYKQQAMNHLAGHDCPKCKKAGYSSTQIRWLDYTAARESIIIQHKGNVGEFKIPDIGRVDGYCWETNTVYEFHGTWWHGHPSKYNPVDTHPLNYKTYGELYTTTLERDQKIRDMGYNLVIMWEHEWGEIEKENKTLLKLSK